METILKRTFFLILVLLSTNSFSQRKVEVYFPMKTYHYNRDPYFLSVLSRNEGGNLGAIVSLKKMQGSKLYTSKDFGAFRNSYGDLSFILQQSIGVKTKHIDARFGVGLVTGYQKAYDTQSNFRDLPGIFSNNGILGVATLTVAPTKGLKMGVVTVTPAVVISPVYINGGFKIMYK